MKLNVASQDWKHESQEFDILPSKVDALYQDLADFRWTGEQLPRGSRYATLIELDPSCAQFGTTVTTEASAVEALVLWKSTYRQAFTHLDRAGQPGSGDPFLEGWGSQVTLTRDMVVSLHSVPIDMETIEATVCTRCHH